MSSVDDELFAPIHPKQGKPGDTDLAKEFRRIIDAVKERHKEKSKVENFEEDKC